MNKVELGEEWRLRTLETRTATWLRIAVVQQVILVGLLANAYFSLDAKIVERNESWHNKVEVLVPQVTKLDARLDALELSLIKHESRLEVLERGTASHAHETRETLRQLSVAVAETPNQRRYPQARSEPPQIYERQLQAAQNEDRATIRVDAPDGRAQFVMGARAAVDNVIMEKEHAEEGGDFTLSRNLTRVLGIGVDGGMTVHTDPLNVASKVRSAAGSPLYLQGYDGINLQSKSSLTVQEVDGQGRWSTQALKIYVGDTVEWSWTNYHNVIETDAAGSIKAGGVSSGVPMLTGSFTHTFEAVGTYRFKSQAQYTMTCTVEVIESFVLKDGKVKIGGDLEISGNVRASGFTMEGTPALGFETEIKIFLTSECPSGWKEASELGGYMLMGRAPGGQVNATKNRAMGKDEDGRMHSTAWKHASTARFQRSTQSYHNQYYNQYDTTYGGTYDFELTDYSVYSSDFDAYWWDRMRSTTYQTTDYMAPIGEYYPFASVLLCKRA